MTTIIAIILWGVLAALVSSPVTTHAVVITFRNTVDGSGCLIDNCQIDTIDPLINGVELRPAVVPPDPRLGGPVQQLTYEPGKDGVRHLFHLVGITVLEGSLNVGIQYADGAIAVYNNLGPGSWALRDGANIDRVTLEDINQSFRVHSLEIAPILISFSPEAIQQLLDDPAVTTPAEFLKRLPAEYRQHWIMMSRSESAQTGTATSPRFILPSKDADKVFGFALNSPTIEYLQFEEATNKFRFHAIDLRSRKVVQDEPSCQGCHFGRPNWDSYDSWAGMLPFNRDRIYENSQEEKAIKRLLQELQDDPVVKQLELPKGISRDGNTGDITILFDMNDPGTGTVEVSYMMDDPVSYPGPDGPIRVQQGGQYLRLHHSGKGDATDEGRGVALFDNFTGFNTRRVAQELLDQPKNPVDIRYVALAIAKDCVNTDNLSDYAPQAVLDQFVAHHGKSFSALLKDTGERRASLPKRKADLQAKNLGGDNGLISKNGGDPTPEAIAQEVFRRSQEGFELDTLTELMIDRETYGSEDRTIALFRFFLEPWKVRVDTWSMSVLDRAKTYTFGDLFYKYTNQIRVELAQVLEEEGQQVACADLAAASKKAFEDAGPLP